MPKHTEAEKEKIIKKIKESLRKSHPKWSEEKIKETAFKIFNARVNATRKKEISFKEGEEDYRVYGFIRTTLPDQEGDITPYETLTHWSEQINGEFSESNKGNYHHDRGDPQLLSVAEYAEVLPLPDKPGQHGLWVSDFVNVKHHNFETASHEMENGLLPAYSVEFDERHMYKQGQYNIIPPASDLWGYAHANRPVDIHAVKTGFKELGYGRIPKKTKEEINMEEKNSESDEKLNLVSKELEETKKQLQELKDKEVKDTEIKDKESNDESFKSEIEKLSLSMKEIKESLKPDKKPLIKDKEHQEKEMENKVPLKIKEMQESIKKKEWLNFKEHAMDYLKEKEDVYGEMFETHGIPLRTTMKMRIKGNKIDFVSGPVLKTKNILDGSSNPGAYTEASVEFADIFQPGIVDVFNEKQGLLDVILMIDNVGGANQYGWTLQTARNTAGGAVDPDNVTVETGFIPKVKLHQEIKVYRFGVSVADYTLYHSRASLGPLFQLELDKAMEALMNQLGGDLYREGVGGSADNQILGLEAVADSTGNTTIYGKTRSSFATTLQGDALAQTYVNNNGSVVAAELRGNDGSNGGIVQLRNEGSRDEDIKLAMNPRTFSFLQNLEDTNIRYSAGGQGAAPGFGFNNFLQPHFDGYPIIVDPKCTSTLGNPIIVIDLGTTGFNLVMSKPPQLTGLAKVSAADSAYVETYLTSVYKAPRRIFHYDNNTGPTS